MSGASNLLTLDGLLQEADESIQRARSSGQFIEQGHSPTKDALESLYEALTVLRNIVVDHLAASAEQR